MFIVDEMGQYVARSGDKLENLRAVVEQFGKVGLERMRKKQLIAPAWVIVTAQEKLEEVYDYVGIGRVELPKHQDSFKYRCIYDRLTFVKSSKRVLSKTDEGKTVLAKLFKENEGTLLANCRLERTHRTTEFNQESRRLLPLPPHYIDLSIDIMNGLRSHKVRPVMSVERIAQSSGKRIR